MMVFSMKKEWEESRYEGKRTASLYRSPCEILAIIFKDDKGGMPYIPAVVVVYIQVSHLKGHHHI